jgi:small subunit ribosomal protein S2
VMFVIDANKEELAIKEANTLGIPVVAILDSNVSPDGIAFPVPANDDAARAIRLYCEAIAIAATRGGQERQAASGVDLGAQVEAPVEEALTVEPAAEPAAEVAAEAPAEAAPKKAKAAKAEAAPAPEATADESLGTDPAPIDPVDAAVAEAAPDAGMEAEAERQLDA